MFPDVAAYMDLNTSVAYSLVSSFNCTTAMTMTIELQKKKKKKKSH